MKIISLISIIISVFLLILALIIYFRRRKNPANITLSLITLAGLIWIFTNLMVDESTSNNSALFWSRMTILGPIFIPALFLLFTNYFPQKNKVKIKWLLFLVPLIFLFFIPTSYNVPRVNFINNTWETTAGPLYWFLLIYFIIFFAAGFRNLMISYKNALGIEKNQIRYVFWGIFITLIFGILTNLLLPLFGTKNYASVGPFSLLILISFISYAIIKHRLLDIRFVLRKSFIYVGLALFVFLAYYLTLWIDRFFFQSPYTPGAYLAALLIVPLFLLSFNYLNKFLKRFTNKYFFSGLYDYQETLETFARKITQTINLDEVVKVIVGTIQNTMRLDNLAVALPRNNHRDEFILRQVAGFNQEKLKNICAGRHFCHYLKQTKSPAVIEEILSHQKEEMDKKLIEQIQTLKDTGVAIVLPFVIQNQINCLMVLGHKISKDAYTKEDIELLSNLANQASIALENARLYQQVQDFTKTLQQKVDEQTRDIKQKNVHLEKLLKMRSEFLDITSHQLRTPTSVLIGILEMATSGDLDKLPQERKKQQLAGAYLKARKLEQIVSDLLRASELDSAPFKLELEDFEKIDLKQFLESVVNYKKLEAEKQNIKIKLEKPLAVKTIYGEEKFLEEAVGNLLDNAIKYTPAENEKTKVKGKIIISVKKDKKYAQIKVKDNGIGIPQKEVKKLFKKFSRASNAKEMYTDGTGLGLFIVKEIVKGHQGRVSMESKMGQGTTFSVFLPLKPPRST
ncbi:MAG: ATP-binding protein [Patescibacteria group bacterium]|nr:ATP-binding protein [Patescibacteria group bacterium]